MIIPASGSWEIAGTACASNTLSRRSYRVHMNMRFYGRVTICSDRFPDFQEVLRPVTHRLSGCGNSPKFLPSYRTARIVPEGERRAEVKDVVQARRGGNSSAPRSQKGPPSRTLAVIKLNERRRSPEIGRLLDRGACVVRRLDAVVYRLIDGPRPYRRLGDRDIAG